jgi:hypothetical protein
MSAVLDTFHLPDSGLPNRYNWRLTGQPFKEISEELAWVGFRAVWLGHGQILATLGANTETKEAYDLLAGKILRLFLESILCLDLAHTADILTNPDPRSRLRTLGNKDVAGKEAWERFAMYFGNSRLAQPPSYTPDWDGFWMRYQMLVGNSVDLNEVEFLTGKGAQALACWLHYLETGGTLGLQRGTYLGFLSHLTGMAALTRKQHATKSAQS